MVPRLNQDELQASQGGWSGGNKMPREEPQPLFVPSSKQARGKGGWQHLLDQLTHTSVRGNVQPQIGQFCIIMTGIAAQDKGQMGIVTSQTKVMVGVSYIPTNGRGISTKTKQPRSLVMLEPGLVMIQDPDGSVWVRSSLSMCTKRTTTDPAENI